MSLKSETVWNRRPGLVGLRLRTAMSLHLEQVDLVTFGQGDDGPLGVGPAAEGGRTAVAPLLALAVERVDLLDLHAGPDGLDRVADLGLGGAGSDDEGVDAGVEQSVGLLGDDRPDDDVAGILHDQAPSSEVSAAGPATAGADVGRVASVNTTWSLTRTS